MITGMSQRLSGLIDSPEILEMWTECKVRPIYNPAGDTTCGYVEPNRQLLARTAPPVSDDAMRRLFWPRTFTRLQGMKEGALVPVPGKGPPKAFKFKDGWDNPYDHLEPPHDPWRVAKQTTKIANHCLTSPWSRTCFLPRQRMENAGPTVSPKLVQPVLW